MKGEPKVYECRDQNTGEWGSCDHAYICGNGLSKDDYRPVTDDYNYIDNW